ncbi:hypothetical protein GH810_03395 [Acetobacterium paludosum]|uniref:Uncharacterized protein n=1 Tax=Acetobacterium paludosum TaxID=52693 RepID=A0A923HZE2_9FIRM|nr:hypothetical protein [Acetobacterium paludosum]MBC3887353.1 hypothetical protein [Acetobacterium paludosum]
MAKVTNSSYLTKRRYYRIETTIHEGALAVSGKRNFFNQQIKEVQQRLTAEFNAMNAWVLDRDGIIGHVKGFIASREKSLMISATGAEVECRLLESEGNSTDGVQVSMAFIVFNIPQLELEEKLIAIFNSLEMVGKKKRQEK